MSNESIDFCSGDNLDYANRIVASGNRNYFCIDRRHAQQTSAGNFAIEQYFASARLVLYKMPIPPTERIAEKTAARTMFFKK